MENQQQSYLEQIEASMAEVEKEMESIKSDLKEFHEKQQDSMDRLHDTRLKDLRQEKQQLDDMKKRLAAQKISAIVASSPVKPASKSIESESMDTFTFTRTIRNFSILSDVKRRSSLVTEEGTSDELRWTLEICAKGCFLNDNECKDYVSISVTLDKSRGGCGVKAKLKFSLINDKNQKVLTKG